MKKQSWISAACCFISILLFVEPGAAAENAIKFTSTMQYADVSGSTGKFQEDWWQNEGWSSGFEEFSWQSRLDETTVIHYKGRAIAGADDYAFQVRFDRDQKGWIRAGYRQFASYSDDSGGFFDEFSPSIFRLNRDLTLDTGRIFLESRLTKPDWPEIGVGYEHRFKDGQKAMFNWGAVTGNGVTRNIFPSYKDIDETVDTWKAHITGKTDQYQWGNRMHYAHYSNESTRYEQSKDLDANQTETVNITQDQSHDAFHNTFHVQGHVMEKVYCSLGYLFSDTSGEGSFNMVTTPFGPEPFDKNWRADQVDIDQRSHSLNLNTMIGPYRNLRFSGGVQGKLIDTDGRTEAVLEEISFSGAAEAPEARIRTHSDLESMEESLGIRYTGIPSTTLYADGQWVQREVELEEREFEDGVLGFQRNTDTTVHRDRYTLGFNTSPAARTTLSIQFRKTYRDNDYDHDTDTEPGYSAFINKQQLTEDEWTARLSLRPVRWLKNSFEYQRVEADIETHADTDPASSVASGDYAANIYSFSFLLTPLARVYFTGLVSYRDICSQAYDNNSEAVIAYDGDGFTTVSTVHYILDDQTDVNAQYFLSQTNNYRDNSAVGLPLLQSYDRHGFKVELARQISDALKATLQYGYYTHDDDIVSQHDYNAHLISVACRIQF